MILCVSLAPLFRVHGTLAEGMTQHLQELADMDIRGVLIGSQAPDSSLDWVDYVEIVAKCAGELGIRVCAHAPAPDISATDPVTRNEAVASVQRFIGSLGSRIEDLVVAVHPEPYAPIRHAGDDEARRECCRSSLETLASTASAHRVRIALENMRRRPDAPNRTGMHLDELSQIISGTDPSTVGICLDTGHANISEEDGLIAAFERNAGRIIHVHLNDNLGQDDLHLPLGQG
ncbi:sugar phosphate isomerase/epimerase family protein, partial [Candidatus Latescibacterota bacterium]